MNKHKKNLDALRTYLGRDTAGLALLDAISRDLIEQRKLISSLEDARDSAAGRAENAAKELATLQAQASHLKAEAERETAKRVSAEHQLRQHADKLVRLESDPEPDGPMSGNEWGRKVMAVLKDLTRRHKTAPIEIGTGGHFSVDDLVVDFSGDEFMTLGKLAVLVAVFAGRVTIVSEKRIKDAEWSDAARERLIRWLTPLIGLTELEKRLHPLLYTPPEDKSAAPTKFLTKVLGATDGEIQSTT